MNWSEGIPLKKTSRANVTLVFMTAFPLMLVALLQVCIQFSNFFAMGHVSFRALYLLSLYIPISLALMAINDSISITNQVLVAKKVGEKKLGEVLQVTANLCLIGTLILLVLAGITYGVGPKLGTFFSVDVATSARFSRFVLLMLLSNALILPGMLLDSTIRGLGKVTLAFLILLGHTVLYLLLLALFTWRYGLEENGIIYSAAICAVVLWGTASFTLVRLRAFPWPPSLFRLSPQTIPFLRWVGLPIFLSYVLLFTSSFFYNHIVAPFGDFAVAGFGIGYRIHTFVILPALALGEGMSILINQRMGGKRYEEAHELLRVGLWGAFGLYTVIALVVFLGRYEWVSFFTSNRAISQESVSFLSLTAFSYAWFGVLLTLLIVLEQTDNGFRAFLLNLAYFLLIVVAGAFLSQHFHSLLWFYRTFAVCNCLGLYAIIREVRRQDRKFARLRSATA